MRAATVVYIVWSARLGECDNAWRVEQTSRYPRYRLPARTRSYSYLHTPSADGLPFALSTRYHFAFFHLAPSVSHCIFSRIETNNKISFAFCYEFQWEFLSIFQVGLYGVPIWKVYLALFDFLPDKSIDCRSANSNATGLVDATFAPDRSLKDCYGKW